MSDITTLMMAAAGATTPQYKIERSLRFNSADSAYLSRTPASSSNRKTWTWSGWIKRTSLGTVQNIFTSDGALSDSELFSFRFESNNTIKVAGYSTLWLQTTQVFRDVSSYYHFVLAIDTTEATSTNRFKLYVNNIQITAFSTEVYPSQNADLGVNRAGQHNLGKAANSVVDLLNGYLTEINFVDGSALTPSSFGETDATTGVWKPKAYAGTYGTNGFYLNFSDNTSTTTLGYDAAGSNDWTLNNFSVTAGAGNDSLVDTPTPYGTDTGAGGEVRGNYCTQNPLDTGSAITVSNGNLQVGAGATNWDTSRATIGVTSGKWYWEVALTSGIYCVPGITTSQASITVGHPGTDAFGWGYASNTGNKINNNSAVSYGATWTSSDVIGVAFDADAGTITFYKNNTSQGTAYSSLTSGPYFPSIGVYDSTAVVNFGQRPFAYTAPSGFKALCTQNLPTPTVVQGDDYFNTVLYTGTGSSQSITGVGFQPDWVWIKERSGTADHALYDAVRGVQQQLESNTTTDETTESTGLTAFGSDGFTVGSLAQVNTSTDTYVGWNWKESTVSKFDIVTYTGNGTARTISHNLGVVPNMIIVKARTTASTDQGWPVYHSANTANPETDYLLLNSDVATADLDTVWNDTAPTSSVFSVGTNALVNANNDTYVAYVFANVVGYSAFGSYTGNGSADGAFIYTGFRPAFVIIKRTDTANDWYLNDTSRNPYNMAKNTLLVNTSGAEGTLYNYIDVLSNGFKCRTNNGGSNASGGTYIYMAFAENPFKYSLAR